MRISTVGRFGSKCATVGRFRFPVWVGKYYEIKRKPGGYYFKLVGTFGGTMADNKPSAKFVEQCKQSANCLFVEGVTIRSNPANLPLSILKNLGL